MYKIRYNILGFVLALSAAFTSCSKEVNIKIPAVKSKPVAFALVENHKPIRLLFNKSYGILDYVDSSRMHSGSAVVKLYVNNRFTERLSYGDGYFHSFNYLPRPLDTLLIKVWPKGSDDILSAQTTIPRLVKIDTAYLRDSAYTDKDGVVYSRVSLQFKDVPNKTNYYEIYMRAKCLTSPSPVYENITGYVSDNPIIVNEGIIDRPGPVNNDDLYDYEPETVVFSDTLFQNGTANLSISFERPCTYVFGQPSSCKYILSVYLSNVTKEYYEYRKFLYKHMISKESNFWSGYVEPVQMYSNITGGYGVFAGYTPFVVKLRSH
jgi:hypothetical protein